MLQRFFINLFNIFISINAIAQPFPLYHPDSTKAELTDLFQELSIKHPGFYRYNDKSEFDKQIAERIATIQEPVSELEIYRLVKPLFAKIGCLHTSVLLSETTENQLNSEANCLPFELYYDFGRAFVWKVYDDSYGIKVGDEILSINKQPIQEIYEQIFQNIPMDGYNISGKIQLLQYAFPSWYRNIIEVTTDFELLIDNEKEVKTIEVFGIHYRELTMYKGTMDKPLSLEFFDDVAVITIPYFADYYFDLHDQNFDKEIERIFKEIQQQNIKKLIVDLRGNTGGSDSNAALFTSYFFDKQFRYWDRIEVTEALAKEVKGSNRLFYGKPIQKDSVWLWQSAGLMGKAFQYYEPQEPAKYNYQGKTVVLINGLCMSSCADVAAILNDNYKATFIGDETGGGFQGNTSGLIPEETLSCGITFFVPLLKYVNAVNPTKNIGYGTIPDIGVDDKKWFMEERDLVMEKALEFFRQ